MYHHLLSDGKFLCLRNTLAPTHHTMYHIFSTVWHTVWHICICKQQKCTAFAASSACFFFIPRNGGSLSFCRSFPAIYSSAQGRQAGQKTPRRDFEEDGIVGKHFRNILFFYSSVLLPVADGNFCEIKVRNEFDKHPLEEFRIRHITRSCIPVARIGRTPAGFVFMSGSPDLNGLGSTISQGMQKKCTSAEPPVDQSKSRCKKSVETG